jgi:hypothetical protein
MHVIKARNINDAYAKGMLLLYNRGQAEETRNGEARVLLDPVSVCYRCPLERVLFDSVRDANPFFHVMEALWMLDGRNDVEFLTYFAKQMEQYAEDDGHMHGAYGFRWRNHFCVDGDEPTDQLAELLVHLWDKVNTRRAVLTMWDPIADLGQNKKDHPCNTHAYFRVNYGKLHIMVCNRSNDIIWGLFGSNQVHFSFLQEYVASMLGLEVGNYHQVTNNFHAYHSVFMKHWYSVLGSHANVQEQDYPYQTIPLVTDRDTFDAELRIFCLWVDQVRNGTDMSIDMGRTWKNQFFATVAVPMVKAWVAWKAKDFPQVRLAVKQIRSHDWQFACQQWMSRRERNYGEKV